MKKIFLAILVIFAFVNSNAQSRGKGTIELVPFIGYTSYSWKGDNLDKFKSKNGIDFGIEGDYYFNDKWSVRTGLTIENMGTVNYSSQLNLKYFTVPINANWHFGSNRKWNLNFGLSSGFLISADVNGNSVNKGDGITKDTYIIDAYKSFQLGVSYGIGYKIEVSDKFSVMIESQNFYGLTDTHNLSGFNYKNTNVGGNIAVGGVFHF
jgi:long-subunit fatty acid transport protein